MEDYQEYQHFGLQTILADACFRVIRTIDPSVSFDDLFQEAFFAIEQASERFNPNKGVQFPTYVMMFYKVHIIRDWINQNSGIPVWIQEHIHSLSETITDGRSLNNLTVDEICQVLEVPKNKASMILKGLNMISTCSIDRPVNEDEGFTMMDFQPSAYKDWTETVAISNYMVNEIVRLINSLPLEEKYIFALKYHIGLIPEIAGFSLSEIAVYMQEKFQCFKTKNPSPSNVNFLIEKAKKLLRKRIKETGLLAGGN